MQLVAECTSLLDVICHQVITLKHGHRANKAHFNYSLFLLLDFFEPA